MRRVSKTRPISVPVSETRPKTETGSVQNRPDSGASTRNTPENGDEQFKPVRFRTDPHRPSSRPTPAIESAQ